ncbi:MAG: histidine--tRNA ligase [Acidobacteriota bacterium]
MIEAIKGARDILPAEVGRWQLVEARARRTFDRYGFHEIRTPIFESTELFQRGIGEDSDIVAKQMYTFRDRKGRSLTLRPESTAPVARAYIQHGLHRASELQRLYYIGPMFRYERPQKGRMRQFYQIGAEAIGSDHPAVDAETLEMLVAFLDSLGLASARVVLNSVGCPACRPAYRAALLRYLEPRVDGMCHDCRRRVEVNPLRCFDCKVEADRDLMARAPNIRDHLCPACREHFERVLAYLRSFGVEFSLDPRLVRGLDYYRRTAFEVVLPGLGAQNALLGGGRYDGLIEELGGPPVPGFGFAVGEDRLVMMLPEDAGAADAAPEILMVALGESSIGRALLLARRLRRARKRVVLDPLPHRSLRSQLRRANERGARFVVILGEREIDRGELTLKRMSDGRQATVREEALEAGLQQLSHA